MSVLVVLCAALAGAGLLQALAGMLLAYRFAGASHTGGSGNGRISARPAARPPVTVLKPLHGDEPLLESALATMCRQDYPHWQVVFGVQDKADPAVKVVERLRARFPDCDMTLVIDPTLHGPNRKIGNLINMLPSAKHDVLVIADSDVHVRPDYLNRLVDALAQPGIGLVTTLYAGLPGQANMVSRLGALQITQSFLPGALLARAMGRQDCLGATMCLRRHDLVRIGGLQSLVEHLADDNVLGRRIRTLGLGVALAGTVPLTTVPEIGLRALFRHELRWARTIRSLEPAGFAASIQQYPLFWALLTLMLAPTVWSASLFIVAWLLRAAAAWGVDRAVARGGWQGDNTAALAFSVPVWLLPFRDVLSVAVMLASYGGRRVVWRGHGLVVDRPPQPPPTAPRAPARLRLLEGMKIL